MKKILLYGMLALLVASCRSTDEIIPAITVRPEGFGPHMRCTVQRGKVVEGVSYGCTILGMPVGNSTIEEAVQKAIKEEGDQCIGLSDVVVNHYIDACLIIYGNNMVHVSGHPLMRTGDGRQ